jgi:hypothetical protein
MITLFIKQSCREEPSIRFELSPRASAMPKGCPLRRTLTADLLD